MISRRRIKADMIRDAILIEVKRQYKNRLVALWLLGMITGAAVSGLIFYYLI